MFQPVPSRVSFPELEKRILEFWQQKRIFERSVEQRQGGPLYVLYDGPPTANASPGIHHVLARVFKDVFPRYKTMNGYYAPRIAGWDTHGLPVELEVEAELGLKSKPEIEVYGIDKFNSRCRQNVMKYVKEWEELTDRIGFWIDMQHPYITFDNSYIETCWWIIKQLWDKGLVYQGYKVTPHCPRCETSLSSHEVALGYKDDTSDPSVYIKFLLRPYSVSTTTLEAYFDRFMLKSAYLLAWTTTPWTLPGNTALAVSPDADYSIMEGEDDYLVMASALVDSVGLAGYREVGKVKGEDIAGAQKGVRYEPLFNPHRYGVERRRLRVYLNRDTSSVTVAQELQDADDDLSYPVIAEDFVSLDDGTGIVHIAPAFGEIDLQAGEDNDLNFVQPVDLQGKITGTYDKFAGKFVKDADPLVLDDLRSRGLLYRSETVRHTYPFCWRCGTPLLYYAKRSWYIKTTAAKDRLISGNSEINWYPEYIKYGRFGDWLENNVDWAVSRERYWGTPLPVWRCQGCDHEEGIGGIDELKSKPGVKGVDSLSDLHRPYIDEVTFKCPECQGSMRRVPEVLDCWFDSGAMPIAQWHYPFENKDLVDKDGYFPADYICEAVDQTRGWFYSLHALSTLLFEQPCFKNVICLGHILDSAGEKMSKSKGNVVGPWEVLENSGADALRWYLYTSSPPGNVRRFSAELVEEVLRKFLLTLWNTYSFFVTYANIDKFDPGSAAVAPEHRPELDRWVLSELNQLVTDVTLSLDNYDPTKAGRRIEGFVENLSNWYVRRSRRRFWKSENDTDKQSAYATLYHCLVTLSRLLAPLAPFITEEIYQNLVRSVDKKAQESVHLADFPVADAGQIDEVLAADTGLVMKVVSLGRAARAKANIKVRQPLARVAVVVRSKAEEEALKRLEPQVLEELNVKALSSAAESELVEFEVKPNLPLLGAKYGREVSAIADGLKTLDSQKVAADVRGGREVSVGAYTLLPEEVLVTAKPRHGYAIAMETGYIAGVATEITADLVDEGLARELVHRLQTMRRSAGFDIADYIETFYQGDASLQRVVEKFDSYIKQETLSRTLSQGNLPRDAFVERHKLSGREVVLGVRRLSA
ncbi:isoleucine--tRNA ligase [Chloroflexota bacterium]